MLDLLPISWGCNKGIWPGGGGGGGNGEIGNGAKPYLISSVTDNLMPPNAILGKAQKVTLT